ncbi:GNAT family N-acetyltransferase [Rhodobacterales bacterium HKCCE2091]|nr:GNAT family N-acetyltransferase [Rhodobacterales bacterium HKCCE2091]
MIDFDGAPASVAEYLALRSAAGLSPYDPDAARIGLSATLHGTWGRDADGALVAMGRLVGDGGCFAQVTDIAVRPDRQRQGLGRAVMTRLMDWAGANLPAGCYLSLIADPGAERLYESFGFELRTGMARRV